MATKLFVGSLSYNTTSEGLKEFFESAGSVSSADVVMDRETGRSRGFGFVEMGSEDEAQAAIKNLDGKELDGRAIMVSAAREKSEGGPRGGGRGGFGGGNRGGGNYPRFNR